MSIYFPEKVKKYKDEIRQVEAGEQLVLQYSIGTSLTTAVTLRVVEDTKKHALFLAIDRKDGTTFFHNKTANEFYRNGMRVDIHGVHVYGHGCEIAFDENFNMVTTVQVASDEEMMYRKVRVDDVVKVRHHGDPVVWDGKCIFVSPDCIVVVSQNIPFTFSRAALLKKYFVHDSSGNNGARIAQDLFVGIPRAGSVLE